MPDEKHLYDYQDYRAYLESYLRSAGHGSRSQLAKELKCQTSFISQVLHGDAQLSLEHGLIVNRYLGHTEFESEYFLLLLQYARAGSKELEDHFLRKIKKMQESRKTIQERYYASKTLKPEQQAKYYGIWYYSAIHMLLLVPSMRTSEAIAKHLALPQKKVSEALEFLVSVGFATPSGRGFAPGKARVHISRDSDLLSKHLSNWRLQAIRAVELDHEEDFFFSGPIAISEKDAKIIRVSIQKMIAEVEPVIQNSPEEAVFCLNLDFFRV